MPIEICTIGGVNKTEGNSVAVKIDDEVVILDMGLSMGEYVKFTEDFEDTQTKTYSMLLKARAVPDYHHIDDWKKLVKAIIPSHGHLDHIGAVPFGAPLFPQATIIATPYSMEVLKGTLKDENIRLPNTLISLNAGSRYKISNSITVEFVHITHSIPQTVVIVLHTPYGKVMYANDFKLDLHPVLGKKPDFARLQELGNEGISVLIMDSLYADVHKKCPSESVAKELLKDVMLGVNSKGRAMIVTTFSSHIARLKSIIELGNRLQRKIVFFGRSLDKYVRAAERLKLVNFTKDVRLIRHHDEVQKVLHRIQGEGRDKYLIVCTGHQGEPKSILAKMMQGKFDFQFLPGDIVVFSCQVIPVEVNIKSREAMEHTLKGKSVRIFKDAHVSGHAYLEDHRDLLEIIKPQHLIPIHAGPEKGMMIADLAKSMGLKHTHVMNDGGRIKV